MKHDCEVIKPTWLLYIFVPSLASVVLHSSVKICTLRLYWQVPLAQVLPIHFGQCHCKWNYPFIYPGIKQVFIAHVGQQVYNLCRCVGVCCWYLQNLFSELLLSMRFAIIFIPCLTSKFPQLLAAAIHCFLSKGWLLQKHNFHFPKYNSSSLPACHALSFRFL